MSSACCIAPWCVSLTRLSVTCGSASRKEFAASKDWLVRFQNLHIHVIDRTKPFLQGCEHIVMFAPAGRRGRHGEADFVSLTLSQPCRTRRSTVQRLR